MRRGYFLIIFPFHQLRLNMRYRVSLVCVIGFIIAKLFALGHHSYWVLLTIIVILKPGFSFSKQRNYQRLIGTIAGGVIGVLILTFIPNKDAQFVFFIVFMMEPTVLHG